MPLIADDMEQAPDVSDLDFLDIYRRFNMHVTLTRCFEFVDCRVGSVEFKSSHEEILLHFQNPNETFHKNIFPTLSRCMTDRCA